MDQKMLDQIVKAVVEEIALTNAGFMPADEDSLKLVKLKAEAEKAKAEMAEAQLNQQRAQAELEKAKETVVNLKLANKKLQLESSDLKRQRKLLDAKMQAEVEGIQQQNVLREQEIDNFRLCVPLGTHKRAARKRFNELRQKMMSEYSRMDDCLSERHSGFGSLFDNLF